MEYKDVLALYFERSNQMHTFWSFYLSVCILVPFLVALMRSSKQKLVVAAVLSFGFSVTAAVNLSAVIDASNARLTCRNLLYSGTLEGSPSAAVQQQLNKLITPPTVTAVIAVQLGGDLITLAMVWYLALSRRTTLSAG